MNGQQESYNTSDLIVQLTDLINQYSTNPTNQYTLPQDVTSQQMAITIIEVYEQHAKVEVVEQLCDLREAFLSVMIWLLPVLLVILILFVIILYLCHSKKSDAFTDYFYASLSAFFVSLVMSVIVYYTSSDTSWMVGPDFYQSFAILYMKNIRNAFICGSWCLGILTLFLVAVKKSIKN